jgi:tetratricopeptide (TPR) repeat protein
MNPDLKLYKFNSEFDLNLKKNAILGVIFILSFQSCGLWENFTTYFNRYYNTKQSFEEAEEAMVDSRKELFEFKEPALPSKAKSALDNVIELSSKILQFNKESAYFDEALFMIGKSYYYQGNYTKALRKFRELQSIPETELKLYNDLWITKSEMQMRRFDEALQILEDVKERALAEENEEVVKGAYLAEIRYYNYRENYSDAIRAGIKLLEVSEDDELNAELAFGIGQLYIKIGEFKNAAEYFTLVNEFSPTFDTEFEAQLELAKVQRELGMQEESLELLDELRGEDKYNNHYDKIDLELAHIEFNSGNFLEALEMYHVVDTTYPQTESSGFASFKRAEIVEKVFADLDSADVLYKRVASTKAPEEMKEIAREKMLIISNQRRFIANIEKFSLGYKYAIDSTLFVQDSTLFADYIARKDSSDQLLKEMIELEGDDFDPANFDSSKYVLNEDPPFLAQPAKSNLPADTLANRIVINKYELGNLYLGELELPDSAYKYYIDIVENNPDSRYYPNTLYALGTYYLTQNDSLKADSLFNYVYDNFKENKIVNAAAEKLGKDLIQLEVDPAQKLFASSEQLYDSSKYDLAIESYFTLASEFPESPYAAKSLYSIGFILENDLQMKDSAAVVYDTLSARYKMTTYARDIASKLNFYKSEKKKMADSLAAFQKYLSDSLTADSMGISIAQLDSIRLAEKFLAADSLKQEVQTSQLNDTTGVKSDSLSIAEQERIDRLKPHTFDQKKDSIKTKDEKPKRRGRPRGKK